MCEQDQCTGTGFDDMMGSNISAAHIRMPLLSFIVKRILGYFLHVHNINRSHLRYNSFPRYSLTLLFMCLSLRCSGML